MWPVRNDRPYDVALEVLWRRRLAGWLEQDRVPAGESAVVLLRRDAGGDFHRGGPGAAPVVVGGEPNADIALALVGAAAITWRRLRVELGAAHWFAREARLSDRPNTGGDIRLTTGNARICPLAVLRPIEVPLCAGVEVGSMHGSGVGIDVPTSTRLLWVALTASAGVIWMPSPWVGLWADAALVVPVSRPIFEAENVGVIHQPAP